MARQDSRHRGPEESLLQSMHTVLKLAQSRWTGHFIRMPDGRLPKVSSGELQEGEHSQGGQKKRYKDTLKDFDIPTGSWEHRSDQNGEASSPKDQLSKKKRDSVKL